MNRNDPYRQALIDLYGPEEYNRAVDLVVERKLHAKGIGMNWDDPAARAALIERVGPDEYNRRAREHAEASIIKRIGKYALRPVNSGRFGRIIMIDGSGAGNSANIGFSTVAECESWIEKQPKE